MAEHNGRIAIAAPPAAVFAFLANPTNLPRWQPSIREAFHEDPAGDPARLRVIGGGVGAEGLVGHPRFTADAEAGRIAWDAGACAGEARIAGSPDGATVELRLRLAASAARAEAVAHWTGDPGLGLEEALRASLAALKAAIEDHARGVPLVSGGTQAHPESDASLRDSRPYGTSATMNPDTTR